MRKLTLTAVSAATILSGASLVANPVEATPLGAAADARLSTEGVSPVTNVTWWGHRHHRFHRFIVIRHHRFHHHHRCWRGWC
jgi:hypothetical protein